MLRYLTADFVFTINTPPLKNGVVVINENGTIQNVIALSQLPNETVLEKYEGIICPGFVNAHCHLELSHMKNGIPQKTGMAGFISEVVKNRSALTAEEIQEKISTAEQEMMANGIVAVGDIVNTSNTFKQKAKQNLLYHNFIEVFDINPDKSNVVFEKAQQLMREAGPHSSIVPHAPYTVSAKLFQLIKAHAEKNKQVISYHNQESKAESDLYNNKTGSIADLFKRMQIDIAHFSSNNKSALQATFPLFYAGTKTILVHNTFTTKEDIDFVEKLVTPVNTSNKAYWCFCPNANLYIENTLPDFNLFYQTHQQCVIGTDSLASNTQLSVLDEIKVIATKSPTIPLQTILKWATLNGAEALGFDDKIGTLEKGKTPGLNLITNLDFEKMQLTDKSEVRKLA